MTDLLTRPDAAAPGDLVRVARRAPARHPVAAAPAVVAAHPDRGRRQGRRGLRGPDDPRGLPRQRDRDPDPVLRAQAARLRRLPDVRGRGRGRGAPADLVLADVRAGDEGPDPDRGAAPAAPDQPRADLLRPQRLLPAALPEQVPEPHRHPGLPQGERRGRLARVARGSSSGRSRSRACSAGSARRRARSTAGATRSTRRSPSATATATPATRSSRRCSTTASTRRSRSSARPRPGGGPRSSAPARPA